MKEITELYEEILQDEGLKAEFVEAAKDNKIEAFLQKNDCDATPSQLQEFAEKKQSEMGLLPDAELDAAAGGNSARDDMISVFSEGDECAIMAMYSNEHDETESREDVGVLLCHEKDW